MANNSFTYFVTDRRNWLFFKIWKYVSQSLVSYHSLSLYSHKPHLQRKTDIIYLSIYLSIYLLSIYLSIYLSPIYLFNYPSIYLLSMIYLCACVYYIYIYSMYIYVCVCVCICIFITKAYTHDAGIVEMVLWQLCPAQHAAPGPVGEGRQLRHLVFRNRSSDVITRLGL